MVVFCFLFLATYLLFHLEVLFWKLAQAKVEVTLHFLDLQNLSVIGT